MMQSRSIARELALLVLGQIPEDQDENANKYFTLSVEPSVVHYNNFEKITILHLEK